MGIFCCCVVVGVVVDVDVVDGVVVIGLLVVVLLLLRFLLLLAVNFCSGTSPRGRSGLCTRSKVLTASFLLHLLVLLRIQ